MVGGWKWMLWCFGGRGCSRVMSRECFLVELPLSCAWECFLACDRTCGGTPERRKLSEVKFRNTASSAPAVIDSRRKPVLLTIARWWKEKR